MGMGHTSRSIDTLTIRPAVRDDIGPVAHMLTHAYSEFERTFPWRGLWDTYVGDVVDVAGRWGKSLLLVAEIDGALAGSVDYYPPGRGYRLKAELAELLGPEVRARASLPTSCGTFRYLAIDPSYRGTGGGRALVEYVIALAQVDGATQLVLHTLPTMTAAICMYARMGFDRLPDRDLYVDAELDDHVLAYALALRA
jgi:ribosomal protein S18 acetylase RimI-like enzyme